MKKIALAVYIFFTFYAFCAAANLPLPLRGQSYIQRGILNVEGVQTPLTVYVESGKNQYSLILDSPLGIAAKVVLDKDGKVLLSSGGALLSDADVSNFVLRDLLIAFGFFDEKKFNIEKNSASMIVKISTADYFMQFENYKIFDGAKSPLPQKMKVVCADYSITLNLVLVKKTSK